jgi:TatD DNase family protein
MIDTHIHLNFEDYIDDLDDVIVDALSYGITKMVVIGIDQQTSQVALTLAEQYPELYATIGVHPSEATLNLDFLKPLLNHPKVVAIGECGIDLYHRQDTLDLQKEVFIKQIELAIEHDLPIVIHTREAMRETLDLLKPYKGKVRGVFHCFSGTKDEASEVLELGFYVGVDGPVTFKNAHELKQVVKMIPIDKILTETDGPFLAPEPYRGKRNKPSNIRYILKAIAELKGVSLSQAESIIDQNAQTLFQFKEEAL